MDDGTLVFDTHTGKFPSGVPNTNGNKHIIAASLDLDTE